MIVSPISEVYRRFKLKEQLIDWFEPLTYQVEPYLSTKKIQCAVGANRTGKTELWMAKGIQICRGVHPTIKKPLPVKGRIISTVLTEGALGTITTKLQKLTPIKELIGNTWEKGFNKERMLLRFKNGSTIQLMADTQDVQQHRSDDLDWVAIDEECKEEIYDENYTRLGDRNGFLMLGATAHKGLTWLYKRIVKRFGIDPDIDFFKYRVKDNYTIDVKNHLYNSAKHLTEREYDIRIKGNLIALEGLVYHMFEESKHICKGFKLDPITTQLVVGVDFGFNNPHAGSIRAVCKDGPTYIIDEYYETKYTVSENGTRMGNMMRERWNKYKIKFVVCDPKSGAQRNRQTGERDFDVFRKAFWNAYGQRVPMRMGMENQGCVEHRINVVSDELLPDKDGNVKLKFFNNCYRHFDEMDGYVYKTKRDESLNKFSKPKEAHDHLMNAMEYVAEQKPKFMIVKRNITPYAFQYERIGR